MTSDEQLRGRHTCFVVEDISAAIERLATSARTGFGPVMENPMRMLGVDTEITRPVTFAYSLDGATELVQAAPEGPFDREAGLGFHHFGGFAGGPLDAAIEQQRAYGAEVEWRLFIGDAFVAVFFGHGEHRPLRLEFLASHLAPE